MCRDASRLLLSLQSPQPCQLLWSKQDAVQGTRSTDDLHLVQTLSDDMKDTIHIYLMASPTDRLCMFRSQPVLVRSQ